MAAMTRLENDGIGALQELLKAQKAQTKQLKSLINDKMRARNTSPATSRPSQNAANTYRTNDQQSGHLQSPGSARLQSLDALVQNATITVANPDGQVYTIPGGEPCYGSQEVTYYDGGEYMTPLMQTYPTLYTEEGLNAYECSEAALSSPGYSGTPYSGTMSYPQSNAADVSPPFQSPLQGFACSSFPTMDTGFSLSETPVFANQPGSSFPSAMPSQYMPPFASEPLGVFSNGPSGHQTGYSQQMPGPPEGPQQGVVGLFGGNSSAMPTYPVPGPRPQVQVSPPAPPASAVMQRTTSSGSAVSNSSAKSKCAQRSMQSLERANQNARRNHRIESRMPTPVVKDATGRRSRSAITKKKNGRKALPRVWCEFCPTEFRGEYEKKRHYFKAHAPKTTMWKIVDPSVKGRVSDIPLSMPLSECSKCASGKLYQIKYNACAHFRRSHFLEKTQKKKNGRVAEEDKRGGKGAGNYPPAPIVEEYFLQSVEACRDADGKLPEYDAGIANEECEYDEDSPVGVFVLEDVQEGAAEDAAAVDEDVSQSPVSPSDAAAFSPSEFAAPSDFLLYNGSAFDGFSGADFDEEEDDIYS